MLLQKSLRLLLELEAEDSGRASAQVLTVIALKYEVKVLEA